MRSKPLFWISILFILFSAEVFASDLNEQEIAFIADKFESIPASKTMCGDQIRCSSSYTKHFYSTNQSAPVWTKDGRPTPEVEKFVTILSKSYQDGLDPEDYHVEQINNMLADIRMKSPYKDQEEQASDLADLDATLTDSFFLYASNLAFGKVNNKDAYPNWIITKRSVNLIDLFNQAIQSNDISGALDTLYPHYPEYTKLKQQLALYQELLTKQQTWPTVPAGPKLKKGMHDNRVLALQKRLLVSRELENIDKKGQFDQQLHKAVVKFQSSHGLNADGVVGKGTFDALNVPLLTRVKQIELNMDRLRWLPNDLGQQYVMVNIPDFSLRVVQDGKTVLSMPVIVGKDEGLQSCVLSSQITYLDINPYWYIPNSIAVKDLLPKLKRDPGYLARNDMKLFTAYGADGTEVDPKTVKWSKIESGVFPYKVRQEPGPENPLGRIKFIFQNKCGIYLHDTSTPQLFKSSRRDFSHGCIRIGKPLELATYLLSDKPNWTEDKIVAMMDSEDSKAVTLTKPMNIHIVYATAWVNESDVLQFRNDIYGIDNIEYPVYQPKLKAIRLRDVQ